ncbi:GlsB/YeaQ/YmgE family stress response membrane protein [Aliiroseovarius lamellibrachiae]|uniref:GlsB/YeaQ/YmgE family stress response membrane protein n=1 Tax=Aliiroseovarius lamellibrachiae TaxID=1924933 RepID=UPI001BE0F48D|nr:GlsB/YeaQ/YmgE family stress response membrane protein [Aliiroseovarius lamellibrachiae]MBT2131410.1 GlsB/YeaQ/YmgE family stress response membrane protein [Aliiroseovarius lamellibrachiae]
MSVLFLIIIGIAAGFIATRLMGVEASIPATIAIGVLGALAGGLLLRGLLALLGMAAGFVGAILGALAVLWLYKTYVEK